MNTRTEKMSADKSNSAKVTIPFKLVLLLTSFILALIGSWSLDGLFFTELFVSGIIICTLMWCREVSLKMEIEYNNTKSVRQN